MDRQSAVQYRLWANNLHERLPVASILDAVAACGIQDYPAGNATLALAARLDGLTPADVHGALEARQLIGAWAQRGAAYLVPGDELETFGLAALPVDESSRLEVLGDGSWPMTGVRGTTGEVVSVVAAGIRDALDGEALTKGDVSSALHGRIPEEVEPWCRGCGANHVPDQLFRLAAVTAWTCMGDPRGNRSTLVRADDRLGRGPAPKRDLGARRLELARRFVHCFAPTTMEQFAQWIAVGRADAKATFEALQKELVTVDFARRPAVSLAADVDALLDPPPTKGVRLLPPGDPFLALRDRETLIAEKAVRQRVWRAIGNPGVVLADGTPVATWRPRKKGRVLTIICEVFAGHLTAAHRKALEVEATMYAPFKGCVAASVEIAE